MRQCVEGGGEINKRNRVSFYLENASNSEDGGGGDLRVRGLDGGEQIVRCVVDTWGAGELREGRGRK